MRAVRCCDGGVEVVEVPRSQGEGVPVRVVSAGICGSDLHFVSGAYTPTGTLGHEVAGLLPDGRPVAIEPLAPCGHCPCCVRGDYNLCEKGPAILMGTTLDGGMADEMRVPERAIVPLPAGVEARDACLVEPLAVAIHGLRLAELRGGMRVAVVGAGTIGLCAAAAAAGSGAHTSVAARHDSQREAAARLGANERLEGSYDLVVDAAGNAEALEQAVALCRPGGTLLLVASYWDGLALPGFALCLKEVRVVPASMYGRAGALRDVDAAAAMLAMQPEIAQTLITHRFPLDAAPEAFAVAAQRASGAIKVVLEP